MDVRLRLRPLKACAHGVEIVLADEQHGQAPEFGEVQALVELALGHGAVAEEAGGNLMPARHLIGKRQTHGQRQTAGDDGVAAI